MEDKGARPNVWYRTTGVGVREEGPEGTGRFFAHIRADEQLRRFRERIGGPAHRGKIGESEAHSP